MKGLHKILALLMALLLTFSLISCDEIAGDLAGDIIDGVIDGVIDGILGDLDGGDDTGSDAPQGSGAVTSFDLSIVPAYTNNPIFIVNNNVPFFTDDQKVTEAYEYYGDLDALGRCTYTMACIGIELMPTEEREGLDTKPSGWVNKKYDSSVVPGGWIYNRCHLIGHQLTGENDNEKNLITGTRYLNIDGMVGFENMTADYIKETGNHVLYRVTPIFFENNLLPSGVLMEAYSVEDNGEGICFNVFCYNVQPGVFLYYETGENCLEGEQGDDTTESGIGLITPGSGNAGDNNTATKPEGTTPDSGTTDSTTPEGGSTENNKGFNIADVPAHSGTPYCIINGNQPFFTEDMFVTEAYEHYSDLDALGRCTEALACLGTELMPTGDRESLNVNPTGWHNKSYSCVPGGWLYNRCHLIGYQLTAENNNEKNLITGTKYLNNYGMLPFENMIADYIKETGNHVIYRVTPIFEGENLLATGVLMEAYSVEDEGDGICFNVFCYNLQEGVILNYATGENEAAEKPEQPEDPDNGADEDAVYILNISSKKVHLPDCRHVESMSEKNKQESDKSEEELTKEGYTACGTCKPFG